MALQFTALSQVHGTSYFSDLAYQFQKLSLQQAHRIKCYTHLYQAGLDSPLVEYTSAETCIVWQLHVAVCNKWHTICACVHITNLILLTTQLFDSYNIAKASNYNVYQYFQLFYTVFAGADLGSLLPCSRRRSNIFDIR